MAFLVSHTGSKAHPANSFVVHRETDVLDMMFRLEYNGAVGVTCRELSEEEYKAEKAKRLPSFLKHLAK